MTGAVESLYAVIRRHVGGGLAMILVITTLARNAAAAEGKSVVCTEDVEARRPAPCGASRAFSFTVGAISVTPDLSAHSMTADVTSIAHGSHGGPSIIASSSVEESALKFSGDGHPRANGFVLETVWTVRGIVYVGGALALTFGAPSAASIHTPDGVFVGGEGLLMDGRTGPIAGLRVPLGRFSLRGDVQPGIEIGTFNTDVQRPDAKVLPGQLSAVFGFITLRASVDAWVSPTTTVSVFAGVDLLDRTNSSIGLALGWHGRAFDGRFAL